MQLKPPILIARALLYSLQKRIRYEIGWNVKDSSEVGKIVAEALMKNRPKAYYLIGPGAKKMRNLARLPVGLRDRLMYKAIYGKRLS